MAIPSLGRYEILDELGRGTMGVVYRGHDPVIDRPVALKTIIVPEALSPEKRANFLERFALEARIAGKLIHPNIVITYDAAMDEDSGTPFIAMELVEGEPLSQRLDRQGRLSWQEAIDIVVPIARALDYAHENGVVHRDVKPANVLITTSGVPKITDFGIAKLPTGGITRKGVLIGTPQFMSPEQLRGEELDGRSDLFCLGIVLYNLLTGKLPFGDGKVAEIFHQVLYQEPTPPSQVAPEIPAVLDEVLVRVLEKSYTDRYQTGNALADDLLAVERGESPAKASFYEELTPPQEQKSVSTSAPGTSAAGETEDKAIEPIGRSGKRRVILRAAFMIVVLAGTYLYYAIAGPDRVEQHARSCLVFLREASNWVVQQAGEFRSAHENERREKERLKELMSQADLLLRQGEAFEKRGLWDQAGAKYEQSLALHRQAENGPGEAAALLAGGRLKAKEGNWSNAMAGLDAAAAVFRIYDRPGGEVEALVLQANCESDQGNAVQADQIYEHTITKAEELDDRRPLCIALLARANHYLLQGQWDASQEDIETVRLMIPSLSETNPSETELFVRASISLAMISYALDFLDEANARWEEARRACQSGKASDCLAELDLWQGRAALGAGELAPSRKHFKEAERYFSNVDHLPGLTTSLENLAELEELENNSTEAREYQREANVLRQRLGLPVLEESNPLKEELTAEADPESGPQLNPHNSPLARLHFLLRAMPRTAASEERLDTLERTLGSSGSS